MSYLSFMVTAILLLLIIHSVRKEIQNRRIIDYLDRAEETEADIQEMLRIVKEYRESARTKLVDAKESEASVSKVAEKVTETIQQNTGSLASKIEQIPTKVVEEIKSGESGTFRR